MIAATQTDARPYPAVYAGPFLLKTGLQSLLECFQPVRLPDIESAALLNRVDTKFVFAAAQLVHMLDALRCDYYILAVEDRRIHRYRTLYFDTPAFDLYHAHVTGRADIYKVRAREYSDTRIAYLEVKHKDHKQRTEKQRLPVAQCSGCLDEPMQSFVRSFRALAGQPLEPKFWNTFGRITLVHKTERERVTVDLDLAFDNGQERIDLNGVAVVEVKQERYSRSSPFIETMRRMGLRPTGFSKYCYGAAQLAHQVKRNALKDKMRMVEKIQSGGSQYAYTA